MLAPHTNFVESDAELLAKLVTLRMPPLAGKRFLNIECNAGFFCGYALFEGASQVIGIDRCKQNISNATLCFPDGDFSCSSRLELPNEKLDVIYLGFINEQSEGFVNLIHQAMLHLADDGLLIFEASVIQPLKKQHLRPDTTEHIYYFSSHAALISTLTDYAWKIVSTSAQVGNPDLKNHVLHIRKVKPYAWLLMQNPGTGKSTVYPG